MARLLHIPVARACDPTPYITLFAFWIVVSAVIAIPSALWAIGFGEASLLELSFGISAFALALTFITVLPSVAALLRRPAVAAAMRKALVVRITLSVIFPCGMALDLFPGLFSGSIAEHVFGSRRFSFVVATTVLQGMLLLVELLSLAFVIHQCSPPPINTSDCRHCGYSRKGLSETRPCPECGAIPPAS